MKFTAVVDIAAFIWDEHQFNADQTQFYSIMSSVPEVLSLIIKERIPVALRYELLYEIQNHFPYRENPRQYNDFRNITISQLTKLNIIDYPNAAFKNLTCNPSLIREHFTASTQQELAHLISYLYSENESLQKLLTFNVFWQEDKNMIIRNGRNKEIITEVCDEKGKHQKIVNSLKKIFEHNQKHKLKESIAKNGERASALRCYNPGFKDTTLVQEILDNSVYIEGSFYGYDYEHSAYVKFVNTNGNIFHGYEVIPDDILKEKIKNASKNG